MDVFFIHRGRVKIDSCGSQGNAAFFHYCLPGGMIGWYAALSGKRQTVTATAGEECVLGRMAQHEFIELILSRRELSAYMLRIAALRLVSESNRIRHLVLFDAPRRIAAELLEMSEEGCSNVLPIPDRIEFAARIGMNRETLSRHLSVMQRKGLIAVRKGEIEILDAGNLHEIVG